MKRNEIMKSILSRRDRIMAVKGDVSDWIREGRETKREDCPLYTADKRFFNALNSKIKRIKWVGDYSDK